MNRATIDRPDARQKGKAKARPAAARQPAAPAGPPEAADRRALFGPLGLALAVLIFLALALPGLRKPFLYDDVSFAQAGEAIAHTGRPYADVGFMIDRGHYDQRFQYTLWHPPLYIYTLGAVYRLSHVGEGVSRGLGIALALVSAALVYLSVLRLLRGQPLADGAAALAALLYLVNPLVVQSALILDIDGTVLTLFVAAFIAAFLYTHDWPDRRRLPLLAALFAVGLWAKLTTPWGLAIALALQHLLARRPGRAGRELLAIGGGGAALFLLTWGGLSAALQLPFTEPFQILAAEFADAAGGGGASLRTPDGFWRALAPVLWWASPYLAALFLAAVLGRVVGYVRNRAVRETDWLLIFGLGVLLVYLVKTAAGFPKYHIALLPAWAILAAVLLAGRLEPLPRRTALLGAAAVAGLGFYFIAYVRDKYVVVADPAEPVPWLILIPAGAAAAWVVAAWALGPTRLVAHAALAFLVVNWAWGFGVAQAQAGAAYSTNYFYGTYGNREAAAYLDSIDPSQNFYIASKDVAWYAANKNYIDQDSFWYALVAEGRPFDGTFNGYPIRVLALFARDPFVRQVFYETLLPRYDLVQVIGDYAILVRKSPEG